MNSFVFDYFYLYKTSLQECRKNYNIMPNEKHVKNADFDLHLFIALIFRFFLHIRQMRVNPDRNIFLIKCGTNIFISMWFCPSSSHNFHLSYLYSTTKHKILQISNHNLLYAGWTRLTRVGCLECLVQR